MKEKGNKRFEIPVHV